MGQDSLANGVPTSADSDDDSQRVLDQRHTEDDNNSADDPWIIDPKHDSLERLKKWRVSLLVSLCLSLSVLLFFRCVLVCSFVLLVCVFFACGKYLVVAPESVPSWLLLLLPLLWLLVLLLFAMKVVWSSLTKECVIAVMQ
jgi:hypothetical protein